MLLPHGWLFPGRSYTDPGSTRQLHRAVHEAADAAGTIADVEASGLWPAEVVIEVAPLGDFWEAEPEHQDYLERIPNGYTCHFIRPGWKLPHRANAA